mgnify:CR=1 FL=1
MEPIFISLISMVNITPNMKTIPFAQVLKILEDCAAVIVDANQLLFPKVDGDSPDGEFLQLDWFDDEGYEYALSFYEEDNQEVEIHNHVITLKNHEDAYIDLTILTPQNVEAWLP